MTYLHESFIDLYLHTKFHSNWKKKLFIDERTLHVCIIAYGQMDIEAGYKGVELKKVNGHPLHSYHLPYGSTQSYLHLTQVNMTCLNPKQSGRYSIYLPHYHYH